MTEDSATSHMPIRRREYSREQLTAFASEHVMYEISAAANLAAMWPSSPGLLSRHANSAVLVSGLVHLRLLDDFIGAKERPLVPVDTKSGPRLDELDSVMAVDYMESWRTRAERPLDRADRHAINAQVAHLAMSRKIGRIWDLSQLVLHVLVVYQGFFTQLSAEQSDFVECFAVARTIVEEFLFWASDNGIWDPISVNSSEGDAADSESRDTLFNTTSGVYVGAFFGYPLPRQRGS